MKKIIFAAVALVVVIAAIVLIPKTQTNGDFLRIHIRADSNAETDQSVKYVVKTAVVDYLTPYLSEATDKEKAMQIVKSRVDGIKQVCDKTLAEYGKDYQATVRVCEESFPDRSYNGTTLPAGVYDALIIELGSGSGNNWWCVVYPPLCFVGGEGSGSGIVYKSKLWEIIQRWQSNR
ncbi:MAG: stage II sporulation protein R [Corallococcus sp.]|nr:stage II sporulation protein R [Corallococcus sp.]MCM1360025.1 stage II sporulation protein R [Corallococcus sp.]MCM1395582.1 stage II sporulation protein R [Corallococcus sp.]